MFRGLRPDEIEVRVGTVGKKGASMLLYKDARCDMNILDETYGSEYWQRDHKQVKDNMYAGIGIYNKDLKEWIWKWDCGTESNTEKEKGEASDSFKRACFNLGIGRELYTGGLIFISCETVAIDPNAQFPKYKLKDQFEFSGIKVTDVRYKEDNGKRFITGITICGKKGNKIFPANSYTAPKKEKTDTTDDTENEPITDVSIKALNDLMVKKGVKINLEKYEITKIEEMTKGTYFDVVADLTKLPDKVKK